MLDPVAIDSSPGPASEVSTSTFAVVAGGGTAGHVLPALAVGRALVERGHPARSIHYVGSRRGIEARLVPAAGFDLTLLPGRGIERRLSRANLEAVPGLAVAVGRSVRLVARRRPAVVLSVGGYAGLPAALAAVMLRVPLVVAESNAVPGAANRLAGRFAAAAAVAFEGTALPRAVVTGNPVRPEVLAVDRSPPGRRAARVELGLAPDRSVVAVFGGSLGALRINEATLGLVQSWAARRDLTVYHVVGRRDWAAMSSRAAALSLDPALYRPVQYEERMPTLYAAADMVVCRAGATSVAELAVVGLPAVLVPLPGAPGDHQTANARSLARAGAAVSLADGDCTAVRLADEIDGLLADRDRLAEMGRRAKQVGRPEAAEQVAALVEEHARPRPSRPGRRAQGDRPARS
jgi:UDP-N-acetylglucosamine--N-acetylmuramyl-(pentapeptide) pyrophosphoryl-undecaprenol N-acetylglucosamine transferase